MADDENRTPSLAEVDLKARLEADHKTTTAASEQPDVYAPYATESTDTSAYVGVSPEYMTHANDTEKPYPFEGVEGDSVDSMLDGTFAVRQAIEDPAGNKSQGGGSSAPSVYTTTSGEDLTADVVKADSGTEVAPAPTEPAPTPPSTTTPTAPAAPGTSGPTSPTSTS